MKAHANTARQLDAGLGFFAHAIPDPVLQEPCVYHAEEHLPQRCGEIILTLEPFIGSAGNTTDALEEIEQSVQY